MRRDQGISSAWSFLLGFVLLTIIVPGVLLGPARAVRIIASAVSSTIMQGTSPTASVKAQEHRLPMVELRMDDGQLIHDHVSYDVEMEEDQNGIVVAHKNSTAFGPFEKIRFTTPRADLLSGMLANWIAGRIGVPVPWKDLVYLRKNGRDAGIHEVTEVVASTYEDHRNIGEAPVAVFISGTTGDPWQGAENWDPNGADDAARRQLNELITLVNDTTSPPVDLRERATAVMDVEAFIRYYAALQVLGVGEGGQVRQALVLGPRTGLFYPVLLDAPLVPEENTGIAYQDRLEARLMSISEHRSERDRMVREAITELHAGGAFEQRVDELAAQVAPSLVSVGATRRPLFSMQDVDHSASSLQWSADALRSRVTSYWDRSLPAVAAPAIISTP